jgi:hypothetical protein
MTSESSNALFPGFVQLSDQIYFLDQPAPAGGSSSSAPATCIIYGWGDGRPKNVAKYVDGYRTLYPQASIILVLATTFKASYQPLDERTQGMMPVIDAAFDSANGLPKRKGRLLVHAMSNAGGINMASTLNAYRVRFGGKPLPHQLMVLDSTPGGVIFREQVWRWSRAMAIGTAKRFPWPFFVTQMIWYAFLWLNKLWETLLRRRHAGAWSRETINKPDFINPPIRRLYLYSKEDDIILWTDIEKHAAEATQLGYKADTTMFEGSDHCGHMRMHPELYWATVAQSWKAAVAQG